MKKFENFIQKATPKDQIPQVHLFKVRFYELESQLNELYKSNATAKTIWKTCQKISSLCLQQSSWFYKNNDINKAEIYIMRAINFTENENFKSEWKGFLDYQKLRIEISHVFSLIFKTKNENYVAFERLKQIITDINLNVFQNTLEKLLVGIDVLNRDLAYFAYKLEYYDEVLEIVKKYIKEIQEFLKEKKILENFRLKSFVTSENFFDEFISQKKSLLADFFFLQAKCFDKFSEGEQALSSIQKALDHTTEKKHEIYKKYYSFYQILTQKQALTKTFDLSYEEFKRNIEGNPAQTSLLKKETANFGHNSFNKISKKSALSRNPLKKIFITSDFSKFQSSFAKINNNKSFGNTSTSLRNLISMQQSRIKNKSLSLHSKIGSKSIKDFALDTNFPNKKMNNSQVDLKSLLLPRPKSLYISKFKVNSKDFSIERSRNEVREKKKPSVIEDNLTGKERSSQMTVSNTLKEFNENLELLNKNINKTENSLNSYRSPVNAFQKIAKKVLTKAFSTKFHLHNEEKSNKKPTSKSFIPNNKLLSRRFSEKPEILQRRLELLKPLQTSSKHKRFSSSGQAINTISSPSPRRSPGLSSGNKPSDFFLDSEEREKSIENGQLSPGKDKSNFQININNNTNENKLNPVRLPTISHSSDSEETPANLNQDFPPKTLQTFVQISSPLNNISSNFNFLQQNSSFSQVPFVKTVFAWVLLKKKKQNVEKQFFKQYSSMSFGEFFGAEYEALREKIRKLYTIEHNPFYFFARTVGIIQPAFWTVKNIFVEIRKNHQASLKQIEDVVWDLQGLDFKIEINLESSKSNFANLILEIKENLLEFHDVLLKFNEKQNDFLYCCLNYLLEKFMKRWDLKEKPKKYHEFQKKIKVTENLEEFGITLSNINKDAHFMFDFNEKMSFFIENLVIPKRKITGFIWCFRKNYEFLNDDICLDSLIKKSQVLFHQETFKKSTSRSVLKTFETKEARVFGLLNPLISKISNNPPDFENIDSLFKELQRTKHESLFISKPLYQIKESCIESPKGEKTSKQELFLPLTDSKGCDFQISGSTFLNVEPLKEIAVSPPKNYRTRNKTFSGLLTESLQVGFEERNSIAEDTKQTIIENEMTLETLNFIKNEKDRRNCIVCEITKPIKDLFPEKPYDFEIESEIIFINPFNENDILLQGVAFQKPKWNFFVISISFKKNFKRLVPYIKKDEKIALLQEMKNYFINVSTYEFSNLNKIIDLSSFSFDSFLNECALIKSIDEKISFFKKFNIFLGFSKNIQKSIILSFQKESYKNLRFFSKDLAEKSLNSGDERFEIQKQTLTLDHNDNFDDNFKKKRFLYKVHDRIYIKGKFLNFKRIIRVQVISETHILISYYETFTHRTEYCIVNNPTDILKLESLLGMNNRIFQWKMLQSHLSYHQTIIGKKLYFNRVDPEWIFLSQHSFNKFTNKDLLSSIQHPYLQTQFKNQTFYELFNVFTLGKCFIKIRIFYPLSSNYKIGSIKIKFEFFPVNQRWKMYKLIMSYRDFQKNFNEKLNFYNIRQLLSSFNHYIFPRICLFKNNLLYSLAVNVETSQENRILRMGFSSKNRILTNEIIPYHSTIQVIKKIYGFYSIFTVKRNLFLNLWTIIIYFPKTNRTFNISIYLYELANLSKAFWISAFQKKSGSFSPKKAFLLSHQSNYKKKSLQLNNETSKDQLNCFKKTSLIPTKESLIKEGKLQKESKKLVMAQGLPDINTINSLFKDNFRIFKQKFIDISKEVKPAALFSYLAKKSNYTFNWQKKSSNNMDQKNNYALFFWEHFINMANLQPKSNEKYVLRSDTYQGILREILYEKFNEADMFYQIKFDRKKTSHISYIKLGQSNDKKSANSFSIFNSYKKKTYDNPKHFRFYLRAINVQTFDTKNFCFERSLPLIHLSTQNSNNSDLSEKIKSVYSDKNEIKDIENDNIKEEKFNFKSIIRSLNENPDIFLKKLLSQEKLSINKKGFEGNNICFLYKGVLVGSKRYFVSILYMKGSNYFEIFLYNQKNCKEIKKKIKINVIQKGLPYVYTMLNQGEHKTLGHLLIKLLKNILVLYIFTNNFR